jgi:hypothetical protein
LRRGRGRGGEGRGGEGGKTTWSAGGTCCSGPFARAAGLKCRRARRAAPARAQSQAGAHAELRWHARRATPARAQRQHHACTHTTFIDKLNRGRLSASRKWTSRLHAQGATPARAQICSCTSNRAVHQHNHSSTNRWERERLDEETERLISGAPSNAGPLQGSLPHDNLIVGVHLGLPKDPASPSAVEKYQSWLKGKQLDCRSATSTRTELCITFSAEEELCLNFNTLQGG